MKLTQQQRDILYEVQFDAEVPIQEIAKRTKVAAHVVQYQLNRMRQLGVIRPGVFIDVHRLGFEEFEVFFSLSVVSPKIKQKLFSILSTHERIIWFAELGGSMQCGFTIFARNGHEVMQLLEDLSKRSGISFAQKSISLVVNRTLFRKKFLTTKRNKSRPFLTLGPIESHTKVDETDYRVMSALVHGGFASHRDIARSLKLPSSTVQYRINALRQAEIIKGFVYYQSADLLGMQKFRILINTRGAQREAYLKLFDFSTNHPNVVLFIQSLGKWDFEIGAEVENGASLNGVTEALQSDLMDSLIDFQVIPVFKQSISKGFLLRTTP